MNTEPQQTETKPPRPRWLLYLGVLVALGILTFFLFLSGYPLEYLAAIKAERYYEAGTKALGKGDFAAAERHFRQAARSSPKSSLLRARIGRIYYSIERWDLALPWLEEAVRLNPDNPTVLNDLGYLLADHDRELEKAQRLLEKAVRLRPKDGLIVDSLGWVYYKLRRLNDARNKLEEAVELLQPPDRTDAEIYYHLGIVYRDLGRLRDAVANLREALDLDPNHVASALELRRLGQLPRLQIQPAPQPSPPPQRPSPPEHKEPGLTA